MVLTCVSYVRHRGAFSVHKVGDVPSTLGVRGEAEHEKGQGPEEPRPRTHFRLDCSLERLT
jgi:hypothetical protein